MGQTCIRLGLNVHPDYYLIDKEVFRSVIELFLHLPTTAELHVNWPEGPVSFFKTLFSDFRMHEAAGGLVFDQKRRLLVLIRHGIPDLPKGHLDQGENHAEAALREVGEETGLSDLHILEQAPETWHAYHHDNCWHLKRTQWFIMKVFDAQHLKPQTEEGITELLWLEGRDLPDVRGKTYRSLAETLWPTIEKYIAKGTPEP